MPDSLLHRKNTFEPMFVTPSAISIYFMSEQWLYHGAPADERAIHFFARLRELGFATTMLSNNKEPRVKSFCDAVESPYIYKAGKPKPEGYEKAMDNMGTDKTNTLFVGDQIFTDVMGANLAGIYSILVKPIHPKEEIQIVLKRFLEKPIIWAFLLTKRGRKEI